MPNRPDPRRDLWFFHLVTAIHQFRAKDVVKLPRRKTKKGWTLTEAINEAVRIADEGWSTLGDFRAAYASYRRGEELVRRGKKFKTKFRLPPRSQPNYRKRVPGGANGRPSNDRWNLLVYQAVCEARKQTSSDTKARALAKEMLLRQWSDENGHLPDGFPGLSDGNLRYICTNLTRKFSRQLR